MLLLSLNAKSIMIHTVRLKVFLFVQTNKKHDIDNLFNSMPNLYAFFFIIINENFYLIFDRNIFFLDKMLKKKFFYLSDIKWKILYTKWIHINKRNLMGGLPKFFCHIRKQLVVIILIWINKSYYIRILMEYK